MEGFITFIMLNANNKIDSWILHIYSFCALSVMHVTNITFTCLLGISTIIQCGHTHIRLYKLSVIDTKLELLQLNKYHTKAIQS